MRLHQRLVSIFGGIRKEVATYLDEQAINAACRVVHRAEEISSLGKILQRKFEEECFT